ncbi:MSHA biogenesis protein MshI [Cellvibrio sp. KY-GH-1]|uniref:type IV pilus biogenesis protein PilM n=1 Tax=Cellvibrio sp. KY-GH-1 TaxID=2303332 RepID=UPI00124815CC|nr:MSHA biogenesis protein MshI [Cellvibrio sp. KY-GH-1]QEY14765.1 MSHA biogenesis protein MshI [Cellvibrio sp. KY-GH-1]
MNAIAEKITRVLRGSKRQNQIIGVDFTAEGVAFAHIQRLATQQPLLAHCDFLPVEQGIAPADLLRARLTKLGLLGVPCNLVMGSGNYQLILGEAPKVPQEELAEALRWRVKDLVQFPIAEAIIDAFFLPEDSARGGNRMAYAVIAQRRQVEAQVGLARAGGLELKNIDIPELVLRNLAETCCDTKRGVAIVKLQQGGGSLQIIRDGNLYLSRQFSLSYNAGLLDDLPGDALVLELQRSLDYFERQMRQVPPSHVYLCGENVTADKITEDIRRSVAVSINLLNLEIGLQLAEGIPEHSLSLCLHAIGAALRQDTVT